MIELSRTVRFCINLAPLDASHAALPCHNSFAGWPSMCGIGAYYELEVRCRGEAEERTGYLMNISAIDKAVRDLAIPRIQRAVQEDARQQPGVLLAELLLLLQPALNNTIASVCWRLTPYYSVTMTSASLDRVSIRQQFEFSASHRLHVPELSEQRNREIFGKCNNVNSHGHNYRIEPTVTVPLEHASATSVNANRVRGDAAQQAPTNRPLTLAVLEQIVDEVILQRFDHKHLNLDTQEFAAINPSVENIAKVCFGLLKGPIAHAGGTLERMTVWETEKTSCSFPAHDS